MLVCPDCQIDFTQRGSCDACGWDLTNRENIPVFLSKSDQESDLFNQYMNNYDEICADDLNEGIMPEAYSQHQSKKMLTYLGDIDNKDICEVGIGRGFFFERLIAKKPKRLVGVDISLGYLKRFYQKADFVDLVLANAENLPFKNEFDSILSSDVIEHVLNVGDFLYSVNRALRMNGQFVVRAPYCEDISVYSKLKGCEYDFVHLRNFTKRSMKVVLEGMGFRVKRFMFDGFIPGALTNRYLLKKVAVLGDWFERYWRANYKDEMDVVGINNIIGQIFMKPIEITAICEKVKDVG